jgi:sigma-E factor negative regulatory protein RseC
MVQPAIGSGGKETLMETCTSAQVKRIYGTRAEVLVHRQSACGHCSSSDVCGLFSSKSDLNFDVDNPLGAEVGQTVEVRSIRALGLRAAFMVYLLPAIFMLIGVIISAELWHFPAWGSALVGFGMLGVAFLIAKAYDRRASTKQEYQMTITKILDRATS